jgi:hypothetical protein
MVSLTDKVAERVASASAFAADRAVDILAEQVVSKRVDQLVASMSELDRLEREFKRLGPDVVSYDVDGTAIAANYSKGRLDERTKNRKRAKRVSDAIDAALAEKPDWNKLSQLGSKEPKSDDDSE